VGSSLDVHPIAALPEETLAAGGALAMVNRGATPYDGNATLKVDAPASDVLPAVVGALGAPSYGEDRTF
jgi:NAD-dependent deacetylase